MTTETRKEFLFAGKTFRVCVLAFTRNEANAHIKSMAASQNAYRGLEYAGMGPPASPWLWTGAVAHTNRPGCACCSCAISRRHEDGLS